MKTLISILAVLLIVVAFVTVGVIVWANKKIGEIKIDLDNIFFDSDKDDDEESLN